ncbi:MAG: ribosome small subunit-dependent GTPase A [Cyclobacteriaceae bacterium]|nr:ribosome small subunit-dependent GTPase A [Cyclobacteriaceae bacterium]
MDILPRINFISRQSVKKTGHAHIIAANIDQALLVVTWAKPKTSLGFIDRFIVSAESFRIPQVLVFNKEDLFDDEARQEVQALVALYSSLNITCVVLSAAENRVSDLLLPLLKGKKTLFSGHSGVGKSTIINQLGNIKQKTATISDFSNKGIHTTTFAEMFAIDDTTYIIDTPGIKELGLVDISAEELSDYFVEMRELRLSCKFGSRCLHDKEPACAIKKAVQNNQITESRYLSYLSILKGEDNRR